MPFISWLENSKKNQGLLEYYYLQNVRLALVSRLSVNYLPLEMMDVIPWVPLVLANDAYWLKPSFCITANML